MHNHSVSGSNQIAHLCSSNLKVRGRGGVAFLWFGETIEQIPIGDLASPLASNFELLRSYHTLFLYLESPVFWLANPYGCVKAQCRLLSLRKPSLSGQAWGSCVLAPYGIPTANTFQANGAPAWVPRFRELFLGPLCSFHKVESPHPVSRLFSE